MGSGLTLHFDGLSVLSLSKEAAFLHPAFKGGGLVLPNGSRNGGSKMEIRNRLKEWFDSIEGEENRRQHLRAFGDFCLDLLEEEYGRIPPEEESGPRFVKLPAQRAGLAGHLPVKGLLIHT